MVDQSKDSPAAAALESTWSDQIVTAVGLCKGIQEEKS